MKKRSERNRDFEAIKNSLFEAGVSVLNAAEAHEKLFNTSVSALAEAMEIPKTNSGSDLLEMSSIYKALFAERDQAEIAENFEAYVAAEKQLQLLEELEVQRLEREARKWETKIRIINAKKYLNSITEETSESTVNSLWTEKKLKEEFKTISDVCESLGIKARTWKDAVEKANERKLS
jgi:hypothetical protein